ncbi:MAG: hypothetical protein AAFU57_18480 [Bacteroidota bacterium]
MKKLYVLFVIFLTSLSPQSHANALSVLADVADVVNPGKFQKTKSQKTYSFHGKALQKKHQRLRQFLKKKKTRRALLAIGVLGLFGFLRKRKKRKRLRPNSDQAGTMWLKILIGIILFGGLVLITPWLLSIAGIDVSYRIGILIGVGFAGLIALSVFKEFNLYDGATNY